MKPKLNILIVEDESLVAMGLESDINSLGYNVVDYATTSKMARNIFNKSEIDLIIMDINLNESINGIDLYKSLDTTVSIIYITGQADDDYIMNAVSTNPIGYLTKPYKSDDLKAMLKLVCYKIYANHDEEIVNLGHGYSYNNKQNELYLHSIIVKMSKNELKLLKLLIDAKGGYVSFKIIENEIYEGKIVSDSALRTFIHRFKIKLKEKTLHSEYGYGLKLI